jgi:hypothetical protein
MASFPISFTRSIASPIAASCRARILASRGSGGAGPFPVGAPRSPWSESHSQQIASTHCQRRASGPIDSFARASAASRRACCSGVIGSTIDSYSNLSSGLSFPAAFTALSISRNVIRIAASVQAASKSPTASGRTASAFRVETSPADTAARSKGRSCSSRASLTHWNIVLGGMPSRSRA